MAPIRRNGSCKDRPRISEILFKMQENMKSQFVSIVELVNSLCFDKALLKVLYVLDWTTGTFVWLEGIHWSSISDELVQNDLIHCLLLWTKKSYSHREIFMCTWYIQVNVIHVAQNYKSQFAALRGNFACRYTPVLHIKFCENGCIQIPCIKMRSCTSV